MEPERSLVEILQGRAAKTPDRVAVSYQGRQLTYGELDARAERLGRVLRAAGVGPDTVVGISVERSMEMVVGLLGIWRAGGAYLPLDPGLPTERLRWMQEDSRMCVLLTEQPAPPSWLDSSVSHVRLRAGLDAATGGPPLAPPRPGDLAYLIFTSGSTGRPKAVEVEQRSLLNLLLSMKETPGLDPQDVLLAVTPLSFDIAGLELWCPLLVGARLELATREQASDGFSLLELMKTSRATVMQATPATWRMLLAAGWAGQPRIKILCGGEPMTPSLARSLIACGESVWNLYGPTETTIWSSVARVTEAPIGGESVSLGFPIDNTRFYILDHERKPVPAGVAGELYIAGTGVARGYRGQPELSRDKFLSDPFGAGRIYQSGDWCRLAPDGSLQFLGRLDHQVKLRGYRIELGEVESALEQVPGVREAAVAVETVCEGDDARLIAYIVPVAEEAPPTTQTLTAHLSRMLPQHMLPTTYRVLPHLPLTPNGKVDRSALPQVAVALGASQDQDDVPLTPTEQALTGFWAELFGQHRVGRHDHFLLSGGHSLLATQLVARVRQSMNVDLRVRHIFEHPVLEDLARHVDELKFQTAPMHAIDVDADEDEQDFALSPAQQGLWFIHELQGSSEEYHLPLALRLRGRLDTEALAAAVDHVVRRHDTLRTKFRREEGRVWQSVAPRSLPGGKLAIIAAGFAGDPGGLAQRLGADAARPFDLEVGPLFRASLYQLEKQHHVLLVTLHHLIADGWSMRLLWKELAAAYSAALQQNLPPLEPMASQFRHFVSWQRAWLGEQRVQTQAEFWRRQLDGAPEYVALPSDRGPAAAIDPTGSRQDFTLSRDLVGALQDLSTARGATIFMTLYAALAMLLYRHSEQDDIVIAVPFANRYLPEAENVIGLFVNTLPLRLDLSGRPSFDELLVRARRVVLAATDQQDIPFDRIVAEVYGGRTHRRPPFFQVMLAFEGEPPALSPLPGLHVSVANVDLRAAQCDLLLRVVLADGEIRGSFEYRSSSFDGATIERLVEQFVTLLASVAEGPHRSISELPMMSADERRMVLQTWNDTDVTFPPGRCLHTLIEEQARTNGLRVAVECEGRSLSYRELQTDAESLARHLRTLGVGPDVLVGICLERSLEMVVGLLGILIAGGGYVPIDPSLPAGRRSFMLADAGVGVVVSRSGLSAPNPDPAAGRQTYVYMDRSAEWNAPPPSPDARGPAQPENLAYLIYTSGSTGSPKGVMVNHDSVFNRLLWMQSAHPLTAEDRVLQKTPLSFDVSVWEVFLPLMFGARLVLARPGGERDPEYLAQVIRTRGITVVHFVPSMLEVFLGAEGAAQCHSLRRVFCSGEALGVGLMNRFFEVFSCELHNLYGPTEAAVDVSGWACRPAPSLRSVPIGRPIANTRLYILDSNLQPVPVGIAGELHIGGIQVARGYFNRPDLTRERFIPDPFGPGRLYKTGDRARYRSDGNVEFLGRLDDQFKIRGIRVEPGEIEEVLRRHASVREAAVMARVLPSGNRQLVAYITVRKVGGAERAVPATLRDELRKTLPDFMVPSVFVVLDSLPIGSHGKLDRGALPAPEAAMTRDAGDSAPRPGSERILADIWSHLLGVSSVDRQMSFFELGGDSISILQLVSAARSRGIFISTRMVFEEQTIERIVLRASATAPVADSHDAAAGGIVPLTPIQHRFFENHPTAPQHFNQSAVVAVPHRIDGASLRRALERLAEHHHALRLRFEQNGDGWVQRLSSSAASSIGHVREVSLGGLSVERERTLLTQIERELQTGLDLRAGPLMQGALIERGAESPQEVLLVVHHLAVDWVSWRVLLADLLTACCYIDGAGPELAPVPCSFGRWAKELFELSRSETVAAEAGFWRGLVDGSPGPIPTDYPREPGSTAVAHSDIVEVTLDAELTHALSKDVPRVSRARLTEVFLYALTTAWRRCMGVGRLFVDLEGHGRESESLDLARTVGWCTSLYPVLIELGGGDIGAGLESVKEQLRRIPNRGIGYGLLRYLNPATKAVLESAPPPEVCFNYAGRFATREIRLQGWDMAPAVQIPHLLTIEGALFGDELTFQWGYSTRLYRRETVQALAAAFVETLRQVVLNFRGSDAGGIIRGDFPFASLSSVQLDRVLSDCGDVEDVYPLAPVQAGILFHCLAAPSSGLYYVQTSVRLHGPLDTHRLEEAFRAVVERHTALRTSLAWEHLPHPVQVVHRAGRCPWRDLDWRGRTATEQQSAYDALLQEGRGGSARLSESPVFAASVVRFGDEEYVLLVQAHHVLLDGWSSAIVLDELFNFYSTPGALLPPARPFRDVLAWRTSQDSVEARRLWRELLAGFQMPTRFGQRAAAPRALARHKVHRHELPASLWTRVLAFSRAHRLTANTLIQAAHALLLAHHSGEHDVVFGVTESGRPAELLGAEQMVGLLINTLPSRVKIAAEAPVVAWLHELQIASARLREAGGLSLIEIQKASDVPSTVPLFDSVLVFENYATARRAPHPPPGLTIGEVSTDERNHYPLTVVAEVGEQMCLSLCYWEEVLDHTQVERMARHVEGLLDSMTANSSQTLSEISPLSEPERQHLIGAGRAVPLAGRSPLPLHEVFERCVARDPDHVALVCGGETLTYGDLNQRANRLARHLSGLGVGAGSLIGIFLPRSMDLIVAILATLKAGAAYVPLEPDYPAFRLAFMLEDSEAAVLLSHTVLRDRLPATSAPVVWIDDAAAFSGLSLENLRVSVAPDAIAYVIYTSGSTGRPKGVEVSHLNVLRLFTATEPLFGFDSADTWTLFHSASFDFSVWEIWGALLYGGRLVVVDYITSRSPTEFLALLIRERVSVLNQTPSAFLELMAAEVREKNPDRLGLRFVIFGGESLVASRLRPWFERERRRPPRVINMYGITETTVHVTFREVSREDALQPVGASLIGRPLPDLRVFVLDQSRRLVSQGVPGEMYVAGPGLARGYLKRPELTRERFLGHDAVPALAGQTEVSRLYRTGDLARILPDGSLEFLGRCDEQVKIRGFRVELGEVESVLAAHDAVRDAVVAATTDSSGNTQLVAFVVCRDERDDPELILGALRDQARRTLPDHMLPGAIHVIDRLPLTPNGKIDKPALLRSGVERGVPVAADRVPPQSPTEQILAEVWSDVLRLGAVGRQDDFFEVGGHSLAAIQVIARLQDVFGVSLSVRLLFEHPKLVDLAAQIDASSPSRRAPVPPLSMVSADRNRDLPLSFSQQRLWFIDQLEGPSDAYHVSLAVRLLGAVDVPALHGALDEIVARHEVLRTTFIEQDGVPLQRIAPVQNLPMVTVELKGRDGDELEAELGRRLNEDSRAPFDLAAGPLIRATLYRRDEREHVLLLVIHHIVSDGWSLGVFWRELTQLYTARVLGEHAQIAPLRHQYADFALWQREGLQGEVLSRQLEYWTKQLAGAPTLLALPTDRARPRLQSSKGGVVIRTVEARLTAGLRQVGRDHRASLFMVIHAAFAVLLHRYTGQSDIVVGVPVAGRLHQASEEMMGLFVNALPLRMAVAGEEPFLTVLARARQAALDAFAHQDVPFELLVSALKVERSTSHTPLFQVMLAFDEYRVGEGRLGGLSCRPIELPVASVQYDLTLNVNLAGEGIRVGFEYSRELFEVETIERMAEHFLMLLTSIEESPTSDVARFPMLSEDERRGLLAEPHSATTPTWCVHEMFQQQAQRTPTALAITFPGATLTYSELSVCSDRLARRLRRIGIARGRPVAILVEDGPDQVVALLAVLRAGGVIVGFPPDVPDALLAQVVTQVSAACVVSDEANRARVPNTTPVIEVAGGEEEEEEPGLGESEDAEVAAADPVYVVYTSGSTGKPKGIVQSHGSFAQFIGWFASQYDIRPGKKVAQWASIGYDGCYVEVFGALCTGATLCMLPRQLRIDPDGVLAWIRRERVSLLNVVPSFFRPMMARLESDAASGAELLPDLEILLLDGEILPVELAKRFLQAFPRAPRLFNQYGPTECVLATFAAVETVSTSQRSVPVGRAIDGRQILLLDGYGQLVPTGVVGEICIRSRYLASGYLDQPELTRAAFVTNPFGDDPRDLMYRTGDLGRWQSDGTLEFVGRVDRQVKVRGVRVELSEIEEVMAAHPAIASCAVTCRRTNGDARLVAYLVTRSAVALPDLREFLQRRLHAASIPSEYIEVAALPRTTSGKVDMIALEGIGGDRLRGGDDITAPRTLTESIVADAFDSVLGGLRASVLDDFFDLGGHSLLATQVVSRLRSKLGIDLPVRILFEASTVATLAAEIDVLLLRGGGAATELSVVDRSGDLPLSFSQQRLWFIDQLEGASRAYHVALAVRLVGQLDLDAMAAALEGLVCRHEVLRTTFADVEGVPCQRVAPAALVAFRVTDLQSAPDPRAALERQLLDECSIPFDLRTGPLFRASLHRVDEREHVLLLTMHHIVSDGWSLGVLWRDLAALYEADVHRPPSSLTPLAYQYADFAAWQRSWLHGERLARQLEYWKGRLVGAPQLLNLPTDRPRSGASASTGNIELFEVDVALASALRELSRKHGVTLFTTTYAAFAVLLARYTGDDDIVIGTPVANRYHEATENLVGFFVNTLPLRIRVDADPTFSELLTRAREVVVGAFAHQDVPFEQLLSELNPERTLRYAPVFQVMLAFDNTGTRFPSFGDVTATVIELRDSAVQYDLTLSVVDLDERLMMGLEYSSELFDSATVQRMGRHFQTLLAGVVRDPGAKAAVIPLLTAEERRQLIEEWSNARVRVDPVPDVLPLVDSQVKRHPRSIAVVCDGSSLTYGELHEQSGRLAEQLARYGVGPGAHVGVCVARGTTSIVLLLAILKAGAVYVPLDENDAPDRLRLIMADSQLGLLVTEQRLAPRFAGSSVRLLLCEAGTLVPIDEYDGAAGRPGSPQDAYVIYTSGSSGTPKGVVVTADALATHVVTAIEEYGITNEDRVLQFAPTSVDVSLEQIFCALAAGATLVMRDSDMWSVSRLQQCIAAHGITVVDLTPSYFHEVVRDWVERKTPVSQLGLRLIIVGGEQLGLPSVELWRQLQTDGVRLLNAYGPTEATIGATVFDLSAPDALAKGATIPVGRPFRGRSVFILDLHGEPVPVGITGELCLGGAGLARGYWNRPDLTEERFIQNPFGEGRLYRTGDRARWLPDGTIALLGRMDGQVKVRGYRVEVGEVETAIRRHPVVKDVVVQLVRADEDVNELIAALSRLSSEEAAALLHQATLSADRAEFTRDMTDLSVSLRVAEGFVSPPTSSQRNWLLRRALDELVDDVIHLDRVSRRFVPGSERKAIATAWQDARAQYRPTELVVQGQQVMQDWERPLMKAMAEIAAATHGDILEIGFGMGISSTYLQEAGVASHTIVESNDDIMRALLTWRSGYLGRDIRVVAGRWQDVVGRLGPFDAVLFDAYPMSEAEFTEHVLEHSTFAEPFFQAAAECLRPGGSFTYYTNEIDTFSRRHQRALLDHFESITLKVVRSLQPPPDSHYWWADSMVAVCATKARTGRS